MPIRTAAVSIGSSTPALIFEPRHGAAGDPRVGVARNVGSVTVWVGGDDVTVASGVPIHPNEFFNLDLMAGDDLYGITQRGTGSIRVLKLRS